MTQRDRLVGLAVGSLAMVCCSIAMSRAFDDGQMQAGGGGAGVVSAAAGGRLAGADEGGQWEGRKARSGEARGGRTGADLTYTLDLGAPGDNLEIQDMYIDPTRAYLLSTPHTDPGGDPNAWRTLEHGGYFYVLLKEDPNKFVNSVNGVPYEHARITIDYRDDVNEESCRSWSTYWSNCRPQFLTRLDYGVEDNVEMWHTLGGFGGAATGVWSSTAFYIESNPWQTLRALQVQSGDPQLYFEFRVDFTTGTTSYCGPDELPIDKITVEFFRNPNTWTGFYDDRWQDDCNDHGFVEAAPEADPQPGPVSDPNVPCVLYTRSYLEKIYPQTAPGRGEFVEDELEVMAFEVAGESEPMTFALYAREDLTDITVAVSALEGEDPNYTIPEDNIEVAAVMFMDKCWAWGTDKYYAEQPWYLDDIGEAFGVPGQRSQQFWLTVQVPPDSPGGLYSGTVTVAGNGIVSGPFSKTVYLTLRVYDVELEDPEAGGWLTYSSPYRSGNYVANDPTIALDDMQRHGIGPVIHIEAWINPADPNEVDLGDLEEEVRAMAERGLLTNEPRVMVNDNANDLWTGCDWNYPIYSYDCPSFEEKYLVVLEKYKAVFADPNIVDPNYVAQPVVPALMYIDEPSTHPDRRVRASYFNHMARRAGLRTWVFYTAGCQQPISGYQLQFDDLSATDAEPNMPACLAGMVTDPNCVGYWDFDGNDPNDKSIYGHPVGFEGVDPNVVDNMLSCYGTWSWMEVEDDDDALDITDEGAIYFWFHPTDPNCHDFSETGLVQKSKTGECSGPTSFRLYWMGNDSYYAGLLNMAGMIRGVQEKIPGGQWLHCESCGDGGPWYNVLWQYDQDTGGSMYINGVPSQSGSFHVPLTPNDCPLRIGNFQGEVDNIVVLRRTLTEEEVEDVLDVVGENYDDDQWLRLELDVTGWDPNDLATITLSLYDAIPTLNAHETHKELLVSYSDDGTPVVDECAWDAYSLEPYTVEEVDLSKYANSNMTKIAFRVTNNKSRKETLRVYFMEPEWRAAEWSVSYGGDPNKWSYNYEVDEYGYLGPMHPWLDVRVYDMATINEGEIQRAAALGQEVGFYTTYPGTQPNPLHSRFFHGLYASKVKHVYEEACGDNCEGRDSVDVYPYAYLEGGPQPWYEFDLNPNARPTTPEGRRWNARWQLVLPSWEDRVYHTLIFETMREGIEDSRVIATLKAAIADKLDSDPSDVCALEAQEYLGGLLDRLSADVSRDYWYKGEIDPIEDYADMAGRVLEDLASDPEAYEFFDEMRQGMLDYIVILTDPSQDCNGNCILDAYDIEDETSLDCNANGIPDECELCAGDLDCDGDVDYDDVDFLVAAIGCVGGDPNCWTSPCPWLNGDCNGDCNVTYADVDAFLLLIGTTCP